MSIEFARLGEELFYQLLVHTAQLNVGCLASNDGHITVRISTDWIKPRLGFL